MKILVTGGAGYIGSHTCVELLNAGYDIVVLDNLYNSSEKCLDAVKELTGRDFPFYKVDMLDKDAMEQVFKENEIDSVIHFAGLKAVGESTKIPITYYHNNITGTLHLLQLMEKYGVNNIVFSSSATVYGMPKTVPITEDFPLSTTNPYGSTKLFIEQILKDAQAANNKLSVTLLRYFNPIGANKSGKMGEDPKGIPNNLLPYVAQVAVGKLEKVHVFGSDYPTPDGTGVRDYIHVVDLALGHLKALEKKSNVPGVHIYNLGTGNGYSVLQIIAAFSKACGKEIPYQIDGRRPGDIAECYADPTKARDELGWTAERDIDEMCEDSWRWQSTHPNGFEG
ncbi:MAG TPA: UDP-glucose 4-epimerase GalE [Candidatus Ornithomonoglobus intestinigallinarum]|uniref:UDP-glucose 4-epimerase n=1 Tax=Candidatus Ornithomonoglobus intestinigallinarum TaxID=2840894 RepID=A0A9D1H0I9_9FIRM|nr:UDP-glucose 4-epimerase GalE [Candidatus Ornithomonoglobus intestinigallinarum]